LYRKARASADTMLLRGESRILEGRAFTFRKNMVSVSL